MAILSVKKGFSGVTAAGDRSKLTTTATYSVVTDSRSDGPLAVLGAEDPVTGLKIPTPNTPHPDDGFYIAGVPRVSLVCPTFFNVQVPYATRSGGAQAWQYSDPLTEPADISWGDAGSVEQIDTDADGNAIVNVLGEPFDPPIAREYKDPVLTISRNEAAFDQTVKLTYEDTVNASEFWGGAPGRARMVSIVAHKVNASPAYWVVVYVIQYRMRTPSGVTDLKAWYRRILNQGLTYRPAPGESPVATVNGELVLLAADGTKTDRTNPHWLEFRLFPPANWGILGLNV